MRHRSARLNEAHSSDISTQLSAISISESPLVEGEILPEYSSSQQNRHGRVGQVPSKGLLQDFILEGLSFQSMESREQDVAKAHGNSFDWIFDNAGSRNSVSGPGFTEWLSTDDLGSIYWSACNLYRNS